MSAYSRDPEVRLRVFQEAGLLERIPTSWQLFLGQIEMAPYVVLPDAGDDDRYRDAPLGHPLLRTPLILLEIGPDHLRVGHGLHAKPISLFKHLMIVFHEGMPEFDLQLIQSLPDGLARFRAFVEDLDVGRTEDFRRQRERIDRVVPRAAAYRACFLEPGGWIDRAEAFEYLDDTQVASFLRPELTSLVRFADYCARTFPERPSPRDVARLPLDLADLSTRALRDRRAARRATA